MSNKKTKAKKMITTAEAKTDNRSASEKGADRIEEMIKNLTSDQTKSLIIALKTKREDMTGTGEGSVGRRLKEMKKYAKGGMVKKKKKSKKAGRLAKRGYGAAKK